MGYVIIQVAGLVFVLGVIIAGMYFGHKRSELRHRERMAAIEKGIELPAQTAPLPTPSAYLMRGLIWLIVGLGMAFFFIVMVYIEGDLALFAVTMLSLIPIGVGVTYLIVRRVEEKKSQSTPGA
jgi:NADH:ubiquinone oxidoreductase subunit 3 (subunit A)